MNTRITITGQSGSACFNIAFATAKKLEYQFFSSRGFLKRFADIKGLSLVELEQLCLYSTIELELGAFIAAETRGRERIVVEGPLSFHYVPDAFHVLQLNPTGPSDDPARIRARELHGGLDIYDRHHFDLVVDTVCRFPEAIEEIAASIAALHTLCTGAPAG
jgi:hypothetical protein